jgi:hypothetical protein
MGKLRKRIMDRSDRYAEAALVQNAVAEMRKDWQKQYDAASNKKKVRMLEGKEFCGRLLNYDPDAFLMLVALSVDHVAIMETYGFPLATKNSRTIIAIE